MKSNNQKRTTMDSRVKSRQGFALILTLSILTMLIALSAVLISYMDTARKNSEDNKAIIQSNIYFSDIKTIFEKINNRKSVYSLLYQGEIPLLDEEGLNSLYFKCNPISSGVNINWMFMENFRDKRRLMVFNVLSHIEQKYEISNLSKLIEVFYEGDIKKAHIGTKEEFYRRLEFYQMQTDDFSVSNVPWEDYFMFDRKRVGKEIGKMDGNYFSNNLISAIYGIDIETIEEERVYGDSLKSYLDYMDIEYDSKLYEEDFVNKSMCEISYMYRDKLYGFNFSDIDKKVGGYKFVGER